MLPHAGRCSARHAPNFPKQIFIMELTPVGNDEVTSTAGYWICRISTLSSNTVNVSSIHTVLVQVDTHFRLGHFSLVWPDPIWYHYTD